MIHVNRSRVAEPAVLRSSGADEARKLARRFFDPKSRQSPSSQVQKLQERFELNWALIRDTAPALRELFYNKCAFCESPDRSENPLEVGHFRPPSEVFEGGSQSSVAQSLSGYWWLAYEWENLYLICRACNERSQVRFPIKGRRALPEARGNALDREEALLIDPCRDRPAEYLRFTEPKSYGVAIPLDRSLRAELTIELFNLNRSELIQQRESAITSLIKAWESARPFKATAGLEALSSRLDPRVPYFGCLTELVQGLATDELQRSKGLDPLGELPKLLPALSPELMRFADWASYIDKRIEPLPGSASPRARKRAATQARGRRADLEVSEAEGWYIRRVEIRNFKAIHRIALDIPRGTSTERGWETGWKVLLGENGAGKSTILQAIVLTFMGEKFVKSEGILPKSLLRREGTGRRAASGEVKLFWVDRTEPSVMRFNSKVLWFEGASPPKKLVLRAYGATRHLPRGPHKATSEALPKDVANLFDPFVPVCDANRWFSELPGARAFGSAALSLKDLLGLTPRTRVQRSKGKVRMRVKGVDVTMDELSAGYQSVVVLATDIMAAVHGRAHDLRFASGIVLIDELDAHLHPQWKMQIVPKLRLCFPRLQFIATTHEPLCLRGLEDNEAAVLRRTERGRIYLVPDLPPLKGLRVDQLLTSEFFGLESTMDPTVDTKFRRLYHLLALRKASVKEKEEIVKLRADLAPHDIRGTTRREQRLLEILDRELSRVDQEPDLAKRTAIRRESEEQITRDLNMLLKAAPVAT